MAAASPRPVPRNVHAPSVGPAPNVAEKLREVARISKVPRRAVPSQAETAGTIDDQIKTVQAKCREDERLLVQHARALEYARRRRNLRLGAATPVSAASSSLRPNTIPAMRRYCEFARFDAEHRAFTTLWTRRFCRAARDLAAKTVAGWDDALAALGDDEDLGRDGLAAPGLCWDVDTAGDADDATVPV